LGERDHNQGTYRGEVSLPMTPGARFIVMLVPDGRVADLLSDPTATGSQRPLFSYTPANPAGLRQLGQLQQGAVRGAVFGFEDIRRDGSSDDDFNDILFQVHGAYGKTTLLTDLVIPNRLWDGRELGRQLLRHGQDSGTFSPAPPAISFTSATADQGGVHLAFPLVGRISDRTRIVAFSARVTDDGETNGAAIDLLTSLQPDGSFKVDREALLELSRRHRGEDPLAISLVASNERGVIATGHFLFDPR
jgi:hypothetical protein